MIYLTDIDLNKNQLMNAVIQPLAVAPTSPKLGQIYCNSTTKKIMWYTGDAWKTIGVVVEVSSTNGKIVVDGVEMTVYTLPKATTSQLGGMIVGSGLTVDDAGKVSVDTVNNLTSTDTTKPLSAAQGKVLKEAIDDISLNIEDLGTGDMLKSTYDTNSNGIVDNAEKLGGQLPSYYAAASAIPTTLSQLTNDKNFIDNTVSNLTNYYKKSETYSQNEVNTLVGNLATIQIEIPTNGVLPTSGKSNVIYLIPKVPTDGSQNGYDEYLWTGTAFEKIGDTTIDLTPYAKNADLATVAKSGNYNDLSNKPTRVVSKTMTIAAGNTSATAVESNFSGYIGAYNSATGEGLLCDWSYSSGSLKVEINEAQSYGITVIYHVTV